MQSFSILILDFSVLVQRLAIIALGLFMAWAKRCTQDQPSSAIDYLHRRKNCSFQTRPYRRHVINQLHVQNRLNHTLDIKLAHHIVEGVSKHYRQLDRSRVFN